MKSKIVILFLLSATFSFVGCNKEEPEIVPNVYVNYEININEPAYINLTVPLGAVKISNIGYNGNGVIVFRKDDSEILAFDATCPQHMDYNSSVRLDENGSGTATCPHCGTKYYLFNYGYPSSGYRLKEYNVTFYGNYVKISN